MASDDFRCETHSYTWADVECVCGWTGKSIEIEDHNFYCGGCNKTVYQHMASIIKQRNAEYAKAEAYLSAEGQAALKYLLEHRAVKVTLEADCIRFDVGASGAPFDSDVEALKQWQILAATAQLRGCAARSGVVTGLLLLTEKKKEAVAQLPTRQIKSLIALPVGRFQLLEID